MDQTIVEEKSPEVEMAAPKPEVLARLKLPVFTPEDPEVWFKQVEYCLADAGVTVSLDKFKQVVKTLDGKYAREVRDLVLRPPPDAPFEKLKEELLLRLGQSQAQKTRQLLENESIGDRTPSQFLRHLKTLAGNAATDDILKALWMNGLNPLIRGNIAAYGAQDDITLEQLARMADCVVDQMKSLIPAPQVAAAESESRLCQAMERLALRLDEQSREISELRGQHVRGRQQTRVGTR